MALWDVAIGFRVAVGSDRGSKDSGLIHLVETTAANVHDLTQAAELLHGEETVVYADAGYQGIEKRAEMEGKGHRLPGCHAPGQAASSARHIGGQT